MKVDKSFVQGYLQLSVVDTMFKQKPVTRTSLDRILLLYLDTYNFNKSSKLDNITFSNSCFASV